MKKFLILINVGLILNLILLGFKLRSKWNCQNPPSSTLSSIFQDYFRETTTSFFNYSSIFFNSNKKRIIEAEKCTMRKCFNFSKCSDLTKFKIHIHHHYSSENNAQTSSIIYKTILSLIQRSKYFTNKSNEACLFILPIDTLSRDRLSSSYVRDLRSKIEALSFDAWNKGQNHLIFNLYSGSYPAYAEDQFDLDLDENRAILAKASFSIKFYRKNFDLAFPLFHSEMSVNHSSSLHLSAINFKLFSRKKYLLTFKGKRYLHGIGTETRNSLFHLNNGGEILLLTTW
jgi:glucuronyl/N-acetylglucosaminyl transferase EXT1